MAPFTAHSITVLSVRRRRYPALRPSGKHRRTASRSGPGALPAQGTSTGAGRRQRQRPVGPLPRPYRLARTVTDRVSVRRSRYGHAAGPARRAVGVQRNPCRLTNSACGGSAFFAARRASWLCPLQLVRALSAPRVHASTAQLSVRHTGVAERLRTLRTLGPGGPADRADRLGPADRADRRTGGPGDRRTGRPPACLRRGSRPPSRGDSGRHQLGTNRSRARGSGRKRRSARGGGERSSRRALNRNKGCVREARRRKQTDQKADGKRQKHGRTSRDRGQSDGGTDGEQAGGGEHGRHDAQQGGDGESVIQPVV